MIEWIIGIVVCAWIFITEMRLAVTAIQVDKIINKYEKYIERKGGGR